MAVRLLASQLLLACVFVATSGRPLQAEEAEAYTPKDPSSCKSRTQKLTDYWCADICAGEEKGSCPQEMCACDGDDPGPFVADAIPNPEPKLDLARRAPADIGSLTKNLEEEVPAEIVGEATCPWCSQQEETAPPNPQKLDKGRADRADADSSVEPSPAASPSPKPSPNPLKGSLVMPLDVRKMSDKDYITPKDPTTCTSISPSATDYWCSDTCAAGMCSALMCKCDGDAAKAEAPVRHGRRKMKLNLAAAAAALPDLEGEAGDVLEMRRKRRNGES